MRRSVLGIWWWCMLWASIGGCVDAKRATMPVFPRTDAVANDVQGSAADADGAALDGSNASGGAPDGAPDGGPDVAADAGDVTGDNIDVAPGDGGPADAALDGDSDVIDAHLQVDVPADTAHDSDVGAADADVIEPCTDCDPAAGCLNNQKDVWSCSPCGNCEPGMGGCLANGKTEWVCGNSPVKGITNKPCLHGVVLGYCQQGACNGKGSCDCKLTGKTVCKGTADPLSVGQETECEQVNPWIGDILEQCNNPGCWDGKCTEEHPHSTILWPIPTYLLLHTVLPVAPGHVLVAGTQNALYEYKDGTWRDVRTLARYDIHRQLIGGSDGTVISVGAGWFWERTGEAEWTPTKEFGQEGETLTESRAAWPLDPDNLYIATMKQGLRRRMNGQWDWVQPPANSAVADFRSVFATSHHDVWVVGTSGLARHYDGSTVTHVPGLSASAGGKKVDLTSVRGTADGKEVYVTRGAEVLQRVGIHQWDTIFVAPEPKAEHSLFVGADDDIWVVGDYVLSHFDGVTWTSESTGLEGTNSRLHDLSCLTPDDCWAVGNEGVVLHFDGSSWTMVSEGQGVLPSATNDTTAVWAYSPDLIFTVTATVAGPWDTVEDTSFVRRHILQDGEVVDVTTWDTGPYPLMGFTAYGVRGLWGTAPDNLFISTDPPQHFDGESWAPLDLPADILAQFEAYTLTGSGDDLFVSLADPVTYATMIAHRKASGGPWSFYQGEDGPYLDLWLDKPTGQLYAMSDVYLHRIVPEGPPELVMMVMGNYFERFIAISHAGEAIHVGGVHNPNFLTVDGEVDYDISAPASGKHACGVTVPPSGPGFLIAFDMLIAELGTEGNVPLKHPIPVTAYKPYAYVGQNCKSLHAAPWHDLYMGTSSALIRLPSPWKQTQTP